MMPRIIQLGRQPYLFPRHPGVFDALSDFVLVCVREGRVDVAVTLF